MDLLVLQAFGREKLAIGPGLLARGLRAAEQRGAAIAPKILGGLEQQAAQGVRAVNPAAARGLVGQARESVNATAGMQRALSNPTTQAMQQRVHGAIQAEAAGAATRTGQPLSKAYEGYMTSSQRAYSPEHMGQVLGSSPVHLPVGETHYMKSVGTSGTLPNGTMPVHGSVDPMAATVVSQVGAAPSGVRPKADATAVSPIKLRRAT